MNNFNGFLLLLFYFWQALAKNFYRNLLDKKKTFIADGDIQHSSLEQAELI